VTPPGAADNGGLIAGASGGSILVGVLPSDLLRYSPLSRSGDGGSTWNAAFFPGALAAAPDGLSYLAGPSGGAAAIIGSTRVVVAPPGISSWTPLVTRARIRRVSPRCDVTTLDAVALLSSGPLVATGCARAGMVGIFTRAAGSWQFGGSALRGPLSGSRTSVLRLETEGSTTAALVSASRGGRQSLVALWRSGGPSWTQSSPLPLPRGGRVVATAASANGTLAVLLRSGNGLMAADVDPGGPWVRLPRPPGGTVALAAAGPIAASSPSELEAFSAHGATLRVFSLSHSGSSWTPEQSEQVSLAYGSSS
jgi:hypothetical protein